MEFNTEQLNIIFPFHVLVNESLNIINFGNGLKKISPGIEKKKKLTDFLELKAPTIIFTYSDIVQKEKQLFLFSVKEKELQLKGQALCFNDYILFILSPVISDSVILKKFGITLRDFAIYDGMVDTLFLLNAQKMALNESKQFYSRLFETNKKLEEANKGITEINEHLEQKVIERTKEIQNTLTDLRSAQSQLIQSEKMASLGELTAGIAHEIKNPLNFVNNFSEVNTELVDELKTELATGNMQRAIEIADNIKENEQKISHHGKRADAIVKGMLQHSRTSSGQKELTDINALADEYLRLAYHGLRAKDNSFNATIKTDYDETIGDVNIIPQDIGRVLLNLINNAFYAVSAKASATADRNYKPTVTVTTRKVNGKRNSYWVEIRVKDNGSGIPNKLMDKIFQPFFTTKPTGQGTGLGLSLSYDIIKAHGGELKVENLPADQARDETTGATFVIIIPVS